MKITIWILLLSSLCLATGGGGVQSVQVTNFPVGGDASAANQTVANTKLQSIITALGTPFQAGGNIGNAAFQCNAGTNLNTSLLATSAQVGEVQASPTANTVLDRLKALLTGISLTTSASVIGHVIVDAGSAVIGHFILDSGAVNATLAAETTKVIGTVNIAAGQTITSTGPLTDTQFRATAPLFRLADSNGTFLPTLAISAVSLPSHPVTNAGTFAVQAALNAETTKVIGTINIAAGQTVALTAGSALVGLFELADSSGTKISSANPSFVRPTDGTNNMPMLDAIARAGFFKFTDGTNTGTIKAGNTTAAAADTAIVTISSPNGGNPCVNGSATLLSATGNTTGTTATQIIALSGTTKIYICSMTIIGTSGTTPTFSLVQGTGSNCGTGQAVLRAAWATTAGTIYAFANPVAVSTAANAVCYLDTGTTPTQNYQITYAQQ